MLIASLNKTFLSFFPVICSITLPHSQSTQTGKPSWENARNLNKLQDYTFAVSHMLWPINIPNQNASEIEISTFYQNVINILKHAALETIPIVKFNRHTKPYWTNSVKECHAEMSYRRRLWVAEGRPVGCSFLLSKCTSRQRTYLEQVLTRRTWTMNEKLIHL